MDTHIPLRTRAIIYRAAALLFRWQGRSSRCTKNGMFRTNLEFSQRASRHFSSSVKPESEISNSSCCIQDETIENVFFYAPSSDDFEHQASSWHVTRDHNTIFSSVELSLLERFEFLVRRNVCFHICSLKTGYCGHSYIIPNPHLLRMRYTL